MRRGELLKLDVEDVNWAKYSITLKPTPKRSNSIVFLVMNAQLHRIDGSG